MVWLISRVGVQYALFVGSGWSGGQGGVVGARCQCDDWERWRDWWSCSWFRSWSAGCVIRLLLVGSLRGEGVGWMRGGGSWVVWWYGGMARMAAMAVRVVTALGIASPARSLALRVRGSDEQEGRGGNGEYKGDVCSRYGRMLISMGCCAAGYGYWDAAGASVLGGIFCPVLLGLCLPTYTSWWFLNGMGEERLVWGGLFSFFLELSTILQQFRLGWFEARLYVMGGLALQGNNP